MEQITIRADATTLQSLEEEASDDNLTRSEYIRNLLRNRHKPNENTKELRSQITQYESELENIREQNEKLSNEVDRLENEKEQLTDELENEIDRLKNEKQTILQNREENTELVEYVEREKDMQERYRKAGILMKTKWAIFGMNDGDSND